jgi:predicted DNA-binding transcriptional regulator YafY
MQKIERLVAITLLLQARGKMPAKRLANILGVSTRTIYRDIMALSLAHVPVSMEYGPGGGYYLPEDYHFESAIFTREEAVSLVLGADMAGNYSLFAGDDYLHRALFKLEATLPDEYRTDVRAVRERILIDTTDWGNSAASHSILLEMIRMAVLEARQIDIFFPCLTCTDLPGMQWQRVDPYGLVFRGTSQRHVRSGIWYLVAYCHECRIFRSFRLKHIERVRMREEKVEVQPSFDLQAFWEQEKTRKQQTQPCILKLCVRPPGRYNLRADSQIVSESTNGTAVVRFEADSIEDAVSYALALGADATVISPPQVRQAVADTALAIAEIYNSNTNSNSNTTTRRKNG